MNLKRRAVFSAAALAMVSVFSGTTALAACNATVNGRPMSQQDCARAIQVYGRVVPGDYLADSHGNWVSINNPMHRGNTYTDARRGRSGGAWGGGSYVSPTGVYDATGGCEGGSCVNILD